MEYKSEQQVNKIALVVNDSQNVKQGGFMVIAYLTADIKLVKDNKDIIFKSGTEITLDVAKGVALINGLHVDIFPGEYMIPPYNLKTLH